MSVEREETISFPPIFSFVEKNESFLKSKAKVKPLILYLRDQFGHPVSYEEIWHGVVDDQVEYHPQDHDDYLRGILRRAKRKWREYQESRPDLFNFHLANIYKYPYYMLCRGQSGKIIPLPGLYGNQFSSMPPESREGLQPLMESGTLVVTNGVATIYPLFPPKEAEILLALGGTRGIVTHEELGLIKTRNARSLNPGEAPSKGTAVVLIHRLRKKLEGRISILTFHSVGYYVHIKAS